MELVDTNIWLALAFTKHDFHAAAYDWFARQSGRGTILFCRATQQSFLRLLTTQNVASLYAMPPLTNDAAWAYYDSLLADLRITWAPEPPDLEAQWKLLAACPTASPKLWMDAYLAAFAVAGGHRLVTTDQAMRQYPGLQTTILTK